MLQNNPDPFDLQQRQSPMGFFKLVFAIASGIILSQIAIGAVAFAVYFYHFKTELEPKIKQDIENSQRRIEESRRWLDRESERK